jgi:hypothetical protein
MALDGDWQWTAPPNAICFRAHRGQINGLDVWLHMVTPPAARATLVLGIASEGQSSLHAMSHVACCLDPKTTAYGGFQPRVAGSNSGVSDTTPYPPGSRLPSEGNLLTRAMALTGVTPVMMTIEDIGVAVEYLLGRPEVKGRSVYLHGSGDAGVAALYYALLDERIAGVALEDVPSSHLDGAPILGVLGVCDMPQAVGLMAPRKAAMVNQGHSFWTWPARAYERVACSRNLIMASDLRKAIQSLLED